MRRVRATSLKPLGSTDLTAFSLAATMTALTLLVAFMTSQPMICLGVSIDLPKTPHPGSMWRAQREDALVVGVFRTGDIYLGNDKIAADQLSGKIGERIRADGGERKVYIRADARARWGRVGEVIDQVRAAGIPEAGFLADQTRSGP
jgi:biopolymer transport protein TolR